LQLLNITRLSAVQPLASFGELVQFGVRLLLHQSSGLLMGVEVKMGPMGFYVSKVTTNLKRNFVSDIQIA
jgi:hypothetical protein